MATEVRLPKLGKTMEDGTIVDFVVKVGDKVKKGDHIFDIETDKATVEVESPADGFVKNILADLGRTLPVGEPVLILGKKDEQISSDFIKSLKLKSAPASAKQQPKPAEPALSSAPRPEPKLGAVIPLTEKQKITAQKVLQSKHRIPCFYLTVKADVTELVEYRQKLNKTGDVKISYNDFIMRALATGLKKFPIMTGRLAGDAIHLADSIGIGLAIVVPDGLVAPIVKDVDKKTLTQIANDSSTLIERARNNKLAPADFEGGCITISNLGPFGVESNIAIVVPGQCSILGIGKITDTCVPDDSGIEIRKLMTMTLSVDHQIANGAHAGQFLDFVRKQLEDTAVLA